MNPFLKKSFQIAPSPFPSPPKAGERAGVRETFSQLPLYQRGARGGFCAEISSQ